MFDGCTSLKNLKLPEGYNMKDYIEVSNDVNKFDATKEENLDISKTKNIEEGQIFKMANFQIKYGIYFLYYKLDFVRAL